MIDQIRFAPSPVKVIVGVEPTISVGLAYVSESFRSLGGRGVKHQHGLPVSFGNFGIQGLMVGGV